MIGPGWYFFLAKHDLDKLPRGDNDYRAFKSEVRSRKDELETSKKGKKCNWYI